MFKMSQFNIILLYFLHKTRHALNCGTWGIFSSKLLRFEFETPEKEENPCQRKLGYELVIVMIIGYGYFWL